jgi:hypothetical protein
MPRFRSGAPIEAELPREPLCPSGAFNRPFMIGICQGQTELSSPLLPTESLIAHAS